jgi:hypothetical protein
MDVRLLAVLCALRQRSLRLADRSSSSPGLQRVVECKPETSRTRRPWPALGRSTTGKKHNNVRNIVRCAEVNARVVYATLRDVRDKNYVSTVLTFYILPTQCIYVFYMDLKTNRDCFPIMH